MNLIEVSHRAIPVRKVADGADRRHIAIHRVHELEYDKLGAVSCLAQQRLKVAEIVVAENAPFAT